jgi:ER lumen protein retaining receptor
MNIFRVLADLSHAASKVTLVVAIHRNSSAEGVSLLTQLLYALVFCARYLDLFWVSPAYSWWNFFFKVFYISSSIYVVYLMMRVYPRTREKEGAWKITTWTLGACVVSAPLVTLVFNRLSFWRFFAEVGRVAKLLAPRSNAHADIL